MSQFDNGIKVGDVIRTYHKGYWRATHVVRRYYGQEYGQERIPQGSSAKPGDEMNSLICYVLVMDSAFKEPSGKRPSKQASCDASFCEKVTPEWLDAEVRRVADGCERLRSLL